MEQSDNGHSISQSGKKKDLMYLKDWHFTRDVNRYSAYETPIWFKSDWLNEFWETGLDKKDDYRYELSKIYTQERSLIQKIWKRNRTLPP